MVLPVTNYVAAVMDAVAVNVNHLPADLFAVGGYVNGRIRDYVWSSEEWDRFPHSYHIRINVTGELHRGNCLDIESGDATVNDIVPWLESVSKSDDPLLLYCNRSNLQAVLNARAKVKRFAWIWCATLDETLLINRAMTQISQVKVAGTTAADMSLILDERLRQAMAARIGLQ